MFARTRPRWPIVARGEEFRRAVAALAPDAEFRGVVLVGASGVGKSTLARALASSLESDGRTVRFVLGSQTGRDVPLGAFSRSVTIDAAHEPAAILAAAHQTLDAEKNLVLVVDDAQLLDPLSATLIDQLAVGGDARLILTIRVGEPVLNGVTALLEQRLLLHLHIDAFTPEQTAELACRVLGDVVDRVLADELHRRSGGNPLLLRGLLTAGRDSDVLVHTDDGWQLHGPLRPDRELFDLLEFRLRSLSREELEAMEVLAIAELLDWQILRELCDTEAVVRLEHRGLIQLVTDGSDLVAELNHPVFGEAAVQLAGVVRCRQLNGQLAEAMQRHLKEGWRRSRLPDARGRIRLAQFMMHSDLEPDLDVIISAAASAVSLSNLGHAEELARFAVEHGGGIPAALLLADALAWRGRSDEVEAVLADAAPGAVDESSTVRWGCVRAANLFWGCGDIESARHLLSELSDDVESDAGAALVNALDVAFAFFSGDPKPALEAGPRLCEPGVPPLAVVWAAVPTTHVLVNAGRFDDAHRVAEAGLRAAVVSETGPLRFTLAVAEVMASLAVGDHSAAERVLEHYAGMAAGYTEGSAMLGALEGMVSLARGELPDACSLLHDSLAELSRGYRPAWLMLVAAWLAQAEGARGNAVGAVAALTRSEEIYGPHATAFLPELELARAWERVATGQTSAARTHALRAAEIANRCGMWVVEMWALHNTVRFGDRAQAKRLSELAGVLNTPLAEAIAMQARGMADHDGDLLDTAADRFADMGAMALAADAAAQAAGEHLCAGRRTKELESSARARHLARLGDIRTPAVNAVAAPLPLTDRQREIAMLVVEGLSNREVADRLAVSVRTVDGHLYRIFTRLGVESRDQLAVLFGRDKAAG